MTEVTKESIKTATRFVAIFIVGWVLSETLKQVSVFPEFATVNLWDLKYMIPVRYPISVLLSGAIAFLDRYKFMVDKYTSNIVDGSRQWRGIFPW